MQRRRRLNDLDHELLRQLARLRFATREQLAYWCKVHPATVSQRLQLLTEDGLVNGERQTSPAIWRMTFAGSTLLQVPMPAGRRQASWSVMAHTCHANQAEITLRDSVYSGFRLLDRLTLLRQGFNPAHGEHAGVDEKKVSYFVLLDDYAMQPERIGRSWRRRHAPNPKYWPDNTGKVWSEWVNNFVVITTDPERVTTHQQFATKNGLPADVLQMRHLWRQ